MKQDTKSTEVKFVRIESVSLFSKWNAFCLYARKAGTTPRKLLGVALNEYITRNLAEITAVLAEVYELED